jgi:hypothetical protein
MTGQQHRPAISDRARRRAIRAHAAKLGVPYSVAARLLSGQMARSNGGGRNGFPTGADEHRAWLFAMRERRSFDLRVRDTRLAADLPLGRAAHLTERFPPLRWPPERSIGPLYGGESRPTVLALLYAVVVHESPARLPSADELTWVAELGEEAAVDIVCAALDRTARLLLDGDPWQLWSRIEAAVVAGEGGPHGPARDAAITLGREFRAVILRRSLDGARHTLDAVLLAGHDGHRPGTRVRITTGPASGHAATIVGASWPQAGPPTTYEVHDDSGATTLTVKPTDLAALDRPIEPEPALT